jgi:hypothetical protein
MGQKVMGWAFCQWRLRPKRWCKEGKKTLSQMYMDESEPAYDVHTLLAMPLYYNAEHLDVFSSNKLWLICGAIKIATSSLHDTLLQTGVNMDIVDARAWCEAQLDYVAFSFPLIS